MSRVALVKLQPNEEIYAGLEAACRRLGIDRAVILASVGSLNDAWFLISPPDGGTPIPQCVRGPGLEIAGLTGEISLAQGVENTSRLSGWITRADTTVTGGTLVRGRNIVCVTYEVVLQEWTPHPS